MDLQIENRYREMLGDAWQVGQLFLGLREEAGVRVNLNLLV